MNAAPRDARDFVRDPARRPYVALAAGGVALAAAIALFGPQKAAASYLGAWIMLLALPVGALPVVIMIERADAWRPQPATALLETLRRLLGLMPVAALLGLPLLVCLPSLYPWARGEVPDTELARLWFTTPFFLARLAVYFTIWTWLALTFARRGGEPWGKAGRFHSTLSGLLAMAAWSGLALSAAILVAPPDVGPSRRRLDRLTPLAVLLAIWAFLHFVQFLILWSANLPEAALWYQARGGFNGRALSVIAGAAVVLAALLTLKPGENRTRILAALVLAVHGLEMFWFVTPSIRGAFKITATDGLALAGVAALAIGISGIARRWLPPVMPETRTGRASA